jgi:hypothetical protein
VVAVATPLSVAPDEEEDELDELDEPEDPQAENPAPITIAAASTDKRLTLRGPLDGATLTRMFIDGAPPSSFRPAPDLGRRCADLN